MLSHFGNMFVSVVGWQWDRLAILANNYIGMAILVHTRTFSYGLYSYGYLGPHSDLWAMHSGGYTEMLEDLLKTLHPTLQYELSVCEHHDLVSKARDFFFSIVTVSLGWVGRWLPWHQQQWQPIENPSSLLLRCLDRISCCWFDGINETPKPPADIRCRCSRT